MRNLTYLILLPFVFLIGCSSMKPSNYKNEKPRFVLEDYFTGKSKAWGIFEDRFGNLRRQFTVDIVGTLDGDTLTLDEHFIYDDGEKDRRVWKIVKQDENNYKGKADDIIGEAVGQSYGNALNWQYDMKLKIGSGNWRVHFNDWMFLQPGGILINRARVTKWGLELGQVTLFFRKEK